MFLQPNPLGDWLVLAGYNPETTKSLHPESEATSAKTIATDILRWIKLAMLVQPEQIIRFENMRRLLANKFQKQEVTLTDFISTILTAEGL